VFYDGNKLNNNFINFTLNMYVMCYEHQFLFVVIFCLNFKIRAGLIGVIELFCGDIYFLIVLQTEFKLKGMLRKYRHECDQVLCFS